MENGISRNKNANLPAADPSGNRWMQVWAIVLSSGGSLLPPIDDDGCSCFMAFPTKEDAEKCLASQIQKGYIDEEFAQIQRVA